MMLNDVDKTIINVDHIVYLNTTDNRNKYYLRICFRDKIHIEVEYDNEENLNKDINCLENLLMKKN